MKKQLAIAASAFAMLIPGAIGLASPAAAGPAAFSMPSIDGMNLQEAEDAVAAAANGAPLDMHSHNITGMAQKQLSLTDWLVCQQSPSAGEKVTSAADFEFGVVRELDAARNTFDDMVSSACD